jgi:hypothetical protein
MTTTVPGAGSSRHTATAEDAARSQHLSRRPSLNAGAASDDDVAAARTARTLIHPVSRPG